MSSEKMCVVIPAYNASRSVAQVVTGALAHVPKVIVADDGSTDGTARAASEAGAQVIMIGENKGKGNALKVLFETARNAGYSAVVSMDADGQHDPREIPKFINAHLTQPEAIIVGSRMHEKEKIPRARYNSMHVARFYISLCANQFVEDTQCGFRLYPLSLLSRMRLTTEKYVTETEILMKGGDLGALVIPVKIRTIYGENGSHFRAVLDVTAITAYVISYILVKWSIEGLTPNRPCAYRPGGVRDIIGASPVADLIFQTMTALAALPLTTLFFVEYYLLQPIIYNFASVRRLGCGFVRITLATYMLPVLLAASILEKTLNSVGLKLRFLDTIVKRSYPDLWGKAKK